MRICWSIGPKKCGLVVFRRPCDQESGMKRLYLLRHAKAVPAEPALDDHGRELTVRGMHDAAAMARYIHKNGYQPSLLLVSTSARTRQTAELVLREIEA